MYRMIYNALTIFDWDDTLFPTSWIFDKNIRIDRPYDVKKYITYFHELDESIANVLIKALSFGRVMIITNANREWIDKSLIIIPRTAIIVRTRVSVISARDLYIGYYDPTQWKINVFNNNINRHIKWANQIISIGDADYEYDALVSLNKTIPKWKLLKTIKLVRSPQFDTLLDQMNVVYTSLPKIYKSKKHMDLVFHPTTM